MTETQQIGTSSLEESYTIVLTIPRHTCNCLFAHECAAVHRLGSTGFVMHTSFRFKHHCNLERKFSVRAHGQSIKNLGDIEYRNNKMHIKKITEPIVCSSLHISNIALIRPKVFFSECKIYAVCSISTFKFKARKQNALK